MLIRFDITSCPLQTRFTPINIYRIFSLKNPFRSDKCRYKTSCKTLNGDSRTLSSRKFSPRERYLFRKIMLSSFSRCYPIKYIVDRKMGNDPAKSNKINLTWVYHICVYKEKYQIYTWKRKEEILFPMTIYSKKNATISRPSIFLVSLSYIMHIHHWGIVLLPKSRIRSCKYKIPLTNSLRLSGKYDGRLKFYFAWSLPIQRRFLLRQLLVSVNRTRRKYGRVNKTRTLLRSWHSRMEAAFAFPCDSSTRKLVAREPDKRALRQAPGSSDAKIIIALRPSREHFCTPPSRAHATETTDWGDYDRESRRWGNGE